MLKFKRINTFMEKWIGKYNTQENTFQTHFLSWSFANLYTYKKLYFNNVL